MHFRRHSAWLLGLTALLGCGDSDTVGGFELPSRQLSLGDNAACLVDAAGGLWCWGDPTIFPGRQVSSGPENECVPPFVAGPGGGGVFGSCVAPGPLRVEIPASGAIEQLAMAHQANGASGFALTSADEVWVWPSRLERCPAQGPCTGAVRIASGLGLKKIVASEGGWCGITRPGVGLCQHLGDTPTGVTVGLEPAPIPGGHTLVTIASAGSKYVALDDTGHLWMGSFVRDTASTNERWIPSEPSAWMPERTFTDVQMAGAEGGFTNPASGAMLGCALATDGGVWCWSYDQFGQHGDGMFNPITTVPGPSRALLPRAAVEIGVGLSHACARDAAGTVWCWGSSFEGELGYTPPTTCEVSGLRLGCSASPTALTTLPPAARLRVSAHYACVEGADASLWCWGRNHAGQLGASRRGGPMPMRVGR